MTRIITVSSGKGGVGKTTLVSNLSAALAQYGRSVIALDSNLTASNLGLHLGMHLYPNTLHDVLEGKVHIKQAMYKHPSGFTVVPADISLRKIRNVKSHEYVSIFDKIMREADFILIDSPAGLGKDTIEAIRAADELITVTNPELPAVTDALRLSLLADKNGTHNLGVVVNRLKKEKHELKLEDIENVMRLPILGHVPEDKHVRRSIALKEPVMTYSPRSPAAQHFKAIAAKLIGEEYRPRTYLTHHISSLFR